MSSNPFRPFHWKPLRHYLQRAHPVLFSTYAIIAAFCTYSCMYAFRKPFAVASFDGLALFHIDFKILLITSQVLGYTLSKFLGIKYVSEMTHRYRAPAIFFLILMAEAALLLFYLTPYPFNLLLLFLNGLPLGMVWGLVFSYLEGRRYTEVLGAGLCITFILSSGFVKSVGAFTMASWGVSEFAMPVVTGSLFILPLLISVWLLDHLPPPTEEDIAMRTLRTPMKAGARRKFMLEFAPGMVLLVLIYTMLTAYRDFRDNFARELWDALGYGDSPAIFTTAEIPVAFGVLVILAAIMFIKNNLLAFNTNLVLIGSGAILVGLSTLLFQRELMNGHSWMILVGLGSYLGYIPFNAILFDRMIATFRYVSTVGFAIYVADAFGYLGSVGLLFFKNFGSPDISWLNFFIGISYVLTAGVAGLSLLSMAYFFRKYKARFK